MHSLSSGRRPRGVCLSVDVTEEIDAIRESPKKKKKILVPAQKTEDTATAAHILELEVASFQLKQKIRLLDIKEK